MAAADDRELYVKLIGYFDSALNHPVWQSFLKNAQLNFEYRENKQWTAAEEKELNDRGQAASVENQIFPVINRIVGRLKNQKTRMSFRGRNYPADEGTGAVLSDLIKYVQQQNHYEYEEAEMVDDGASCGFGVISTSIELEDGFPTIKLAYEDALNVFPDPFSKHYNWNKDARFVCRAKWMMEDDVVAMFPDKTAIIKAARSTDPGLASISTFKQENYVDPNLPRLRVIQIEYKVIKARKRAIDDNGIYDVTDAPPAKIKKLTKAGAEIENYIQTEMRVATLCLGGLLEDKPSPYRHGMFSLVPYFVYRKKDGEPYSIINILRDPQMAINKRLSKALWLISTNQVMFEEGGVTDKDDLRREVARPDGLLAVKRGYKMDIRKNIDLANSQMQLMAESKQAIKELSGFIRDSRMEIRSSSQLQRQQQEDDLPIVNFFENLRRTRQILGMVIYGLIKQFYTAEMVFNITDDQAAARQVTLTSDQLKTIKEGKFDLIVEDMPDTTTIADEQFGELTQFLQGLNLPPNFIMGLLPKLVQMSRLRNKEEISKMIEQMGQPSPEQPKISLSIDWNELQTPEKAKFASVMGFDDLAQMEMQMQSKPAHIVKAEEGIAKTNIKAQADVQKAMASKEDPAIEMQKAEIELVKAEEEMAMERERHAMEMQHEHEKHQAKMQQEGQKGMQKMMQTAQAHQVNMLKLRETKKEKDAGNNDKS